MAMAKQSDEKLWTGFGRARTASDVLVWRPAPKRRGIDFKMAWQDVPATRSSLVSPDRNGAMVVADCRVILHRRTTYAGLVMKRVRLDETRVMLTIVTVGVMLIALTASRNEAHQQLLNHTGDGQRLVERDGDTQTG
jgi:hypothetical protein